MRRISDHGTGLTVSQEGRKEAGWCRKKLSLQSVQLWGQRGWGALSTNGLLQESHRQEWPSNNTSSRRSYWLRAALAKYGLSVNVTVDPIVVEAGGYWLTGQVLSWRVWPKRCVAECVVWGRQTLNKQKENACFQREVDGIAGKLICSHCSALLCSMSPEQHYPCCFLYPLPLW